MSVRIVEYICPSCGSTSNRCECKGIKEYCRNCGAELMENMSHSFRENGEWKSSEQIQNKRKCVQHEAKQQELLFEWAHMAKCTYPELDMMYHVPNGGSRNEIEAAKLKKQGVKKGVPDIHLPVARGKYHSIYIEMKVRPNKPTSTQLEWITRLKA